MTGQAAHVLAIVLAALPGKMGAIPLVTLKTRFVGLRCRQPGRIDDVFDFEGCNVLCAVTVAALAGRGACIRQEFGALAVNVEVVGHHNLLVTLLALRSNYRCLS